MKDMDIRLFSVGYLIFLLFMVGITLFFWILWVYLVYISINRFDILKVFYLALFFFIPFMLSFVCHGIYHNIKNKCENSKKDNITNDRGVGRDHSNVKDLFFSIFVIILLTSFSIVWVWGTYREISKSENMFVIIIMVLFSFFLLFITVGLWGEMIQNARELMARRLKNEDETH